MQDNQQQPATSTSSRALNIPEILMAVGASFYLSGDGQTTKWATNKDKIVCLVAFIQVSKLWFRTFHPILWHSYSPFTMSLFTEYSVLTNAPHIRIFYHFDELSRQLNCTQLVTLELLKSYTVRKILDLPLERQLVSTNPGLRTLVWEGPQSSVFIDLQKDDFTELGCVRELVLYRWSNNNMPFIDVLRPMASSLTILELCHITNFSIGNLMEDSDRTNTRVTLPRLETVLVDTYRYEYVRRVSPTVMRELVVASPNLRTLGLKLHQVDDRHGARELAMYLREYCPNFHELTIHCVHNHLDVESATVVPTTAFIRDCSTSGLTKLAVWDAPWNNNEFFLAIITHARTLVDLELSWAVEGYFDVRSVDGARCILPLFIQCHQLKRFMITDVPLGELIDIFDVWKNEEWGCKGLETFGIKFAWDGDDEDGAASDEDEYDAEIDQISGINPVMGWYQHDGDKRHVFSGLVKYLFRMLAGKESVKTLLVDKYEYSRLSVPPVRRPVRLYRR
ncbi:hypothetical protein BG015_006226 [Linnemannia schmuckeri]|uniref:F-box domain-containing protein n=1 Tax=Linnemannia schmuckeri TaxID=64567 RepID=A0A9P5VC51_9FUNG|nr:hypothetical protein BG015_006226 [Linnemannia schmuckeri]